MSPLILHASMERNDPLAIITAILTIGKYLNDTAAAAAIVIVGGVRVTFHLLQDLLERNLLTMERMTLNQLSKGCCIETYFYP